MEDEEEQETTEILFAEDVIQEGPVDEDPILMDREISASMKMSTAELLTQEPVVENVVEVVKVTETVVEETADEGGGEMEGIEKEAESENEPQPEQMEEVEDTNNVTIGERTEVVQSANEFQENRSDQQINYFSTQGDSSSTNYPASTPSGPHHSNQDLSQIPTNQPDSQQHCSSNQTSMHPPSSPKPQPTFLPPLQSSPIQPSPPKATPVLPIHASAKIQVKETPFPTQSPPQQRALFTSSTTQITATAPSSVKEPIGRRRHKRERHEEEHGGPVIPKFTRKEKKMKVDLEAIAREDLQKFLARSKELGKIREKDKEEKKATMEEVAEQSLEVEEKVETIIKPEQMEDVVQESSEVEEKMDEMIEVYQAKEVIQESSEVDVRVDDTVEPRHTEEIVQGTSEVVEKEDTTIGSDRTEEVEVEIQQVVEHEISEPEPAIPIPSGALPDAQRDSQSADIPETRWGRVANHWRRFTHFDT